MLLAVLRACAGSAAMVTLLVFAFLISEAAPTIARVGLSRFFCDAVWSPTSGQFELLPMLAGTLLSVVLALLVALPLGLISGVFCCYYAPLRVRLLYRRVLELLAGIPSVVYGFWGLTSVVPIIASWQAPGVSLLAAAGVLALMILPTAALAVCAALESVPRDAFASGQALGLGDWDTLRVAVFPHARGGMLTGALLAAGRALGETMAVLMVSGNMIAVPHSLFDPFRTLAANIALEMAYATGDHRGALFVSGALLVAMVTALVALSRVVSPQEAA